jgi:hypothetical protein
MFGKNKNDPWQAIIKRHETDPEEALVLALDLLSISSANHIYNEKISGITNTENDFKEKMFEVYMELFCFYSHYVTRVAYNNSSSEEVHQQFIKKFWYALAQCAEARYWHLFNNTSRAYTKIALDKIIKTNKEYGHLDFNGKNAQDENSVFAHVRNNIAKVFGENGKYHLETQHDIYIAQSWDYMKRQFDLTQWAKDVIEIYNTQNR